MANRMASSPGLLAPGSGGGTRASRGRARTRAADARRSRVATPRHGGARRSASSASRCAEGPWTGVPMRASAGGLASRPGRAGAKPSALPETPASPSAHGQRGRWQAGRARAACCTRRAGSSRRSRSSPAAGAATPRGLTTVRQMTACLEARRATVQLARQPFPYRFSQCLRTMRAVSAIPTDPAIAPSAWARSGPLFRRALSSPWVR